MSREGYETHRLLIVTGEKGAGKTLWCERLVEAAHNRGLVVAGLLSPGRYEGNRKTGIIARNVLSDEERVLAVPSTSDTGCRWQFVEETLAWGNECLQTVPACHTLVIDEIGRLELLEERGWTAVWTALASGAYQRAVLVVRPSLVGAAQKRLQKSVGEEAAVHDMGGAT